MERDTHMEKDHKGVSTEMTKQEKLLAEEWHKRESREEKDRRAKEKWERGVDKVSQPRRNSRQAEEKKKEEEASNTNQGRGRMC